MKLDRYDIALVNGTGKEDARPMLQNVHLNKGRLEVADGFMLAFRETDVTPEEKEITTLLPAKILRTIKSTTKRQAILAVGTEELQVRYQNETGEPVDFNPTLSFHPGDTSGTYPELTQLFPKDTTKKAHIAVGVGLLKRLLACLPDDGHLRIGITEPDKPLEFECSNMDRPIRGLVMPMFVDWQDFKWYRESEPEGKALTPNQ
uniref:DNA polymerase n=1 Tax=viral metagenome TaxID=1070528 RepID=A0A6M3LJ28_9ZZZZ